MKLDFLICGTPTDAFCSQIAFFRLCLDNLGGDYKKARLVATFGDHVKESIPTRWKHYFNNIEVHWSHPVGAFNESHQTQHYHRFKIIRADADMAFICDADMALLKPMPELLDMCNRAPALYGVIAHFHMPFKKSWLEIAKNVIDKPIKIKYRYTLKPHDTPNEAPFYINYGFLAGTPKLLQEFYQRDAELLNAVSNEVDNYWGPQVGLAITVEDLDLPHFALPMRYNYPNDKQADKLYSNEIQNIILLHYLRKNKFDRHKIFISKQEFDRFISLELEGSNEIFQSFVKCLTNSTYPFEY